MTNQASGGRVALALVASLLMFAGWALAIVPAFHNLAQVTVAIVLGLLLFALALIPAGMDTLYPDRIGGKRGLGNAVVSVLPAVALIVLAALVMPIAPIFAVLAIVAEVMGIGLYLWDWYSGTRRQPAARA